MSAQIRFLLSLLLLLATGQVQATEIHKASVSSSPTLSTSHTQAYLLAESVSPILTYKTTLPYQEHERSDLPETEDDNDDNEQSFLKKCTGSSDYFAGFYSAYYRHHTCSCAKPTFTDGRNTLLASGRHIVFRSIRV